PELSKEQVNQLITDSLRQETKSTEELTGLVMNKTRGNPFFINQFIQKLVQEQIIYFETSDGKWKWDTEGISGINITDNVVDLLVSKIQTLSIETQHLLRLASCIGNRFDVGTLSVISEKEGDKIAASLWEAVKEDLLNPLGQRSKHFDDKLWKQL